MKVGTGWQYLYRAADKEGATIEFMLSVKRDVFAAIGFHGWIRNLPLETCFSISLVLKGRGA